VKYCGCHRPQHPRQALKDLMDEVREFFDEPSRDEASDIAYGIGRLLAGVFGKEYFRIPGDQLHMEKIQQRMREYGCIRSKRHLRGGRCPSDV